MNKNRLGPQELKQRLQEAGFHPDILMAKKDGTFEAKRSYFYRFGTTVNDFAAWVQEAAEKAGLDCTILSADDLWAAWPRTSWYRVRFTLTERRPQQEAPTQDETTGGERN